MQIIHKLETQAGKIIALCHPEKGEHFARVWMDHGRATTKWELVTCGFCKRARREYEEDGKGEEGSQEKQEAR